MLSGDKPTKKKTKSGYKSVITFLVEISWMRSRQYAIDAFALQSRVLQLNDRLLLSFEFFLEICCVVGHAKASASPNKRTTSAQSEAQSFFFS